MELKLDALRDFVREKASNTEFVHHKWFARWHLEVVEKIAANLLEYYPEADSDIVYAMVWMHDYGKIIDFANQYDHSYVDAGRNELIKLGFDDDFAYTVAENIKTLDKKDDLEHANIETRIVSSSDGCSHLVGPFMSLYWWENPQKPFEEIMQDNIRKLTVDWEKKVVIPEALSAFKNLHDIALDTAKGTVPRSVTGPVS